MKNSFLKSLMAMGLVLGVVGCGSGSSVSEEGENPPLPSATLEDLKDSITYMYNEESLAYDVYLNINKELVAKQDINVSTLHKIATTSEINHIKQVDDLAFAYDLNMSTYDPTLKPYTTEGVGDGKYSVPHVQVLYDLLYAKGIKSKKDALEVGCMVEVVDIDDLDRYIDMATELNATDALDAFHILIDGSYNHYWAFDSALMKENNSIDEMDGCCSVADEFGLGLDFCQQDYPKK